MIYWMSFDDTDESIHSINSNKYNKFFKTSPCPALIVLGCMYFCIVRKILWRIQYFCFDLYMFYSICMYIFSHKLWISSINIKIRILDYIYHKRNHYVEEQYDFGTDFIWECGCNFIHFLLIQIPNKIYLNSFDNWMEADYRDIRSSPLAPHTMAYVRLF